MKSDIDLASDRSVAVIETIAVQNYIDMATRVVSRVCAKTVCHAVTVIHARSPDWDVLRRAFIVGRPLLSMEEGTELVALVSLSATTIGTTIPRTWLTGWRPQDRMVRNSVDCGSSRELPTELWLPCGAAGYKELGCSLQKQSNVAWRCGSRRSLTLNMQLSGRLMQFPLGNACRNCQTV